MGLQRFNRLSRSSLYTSLQHEALDLIIIGGGITGASIFRDAVLRGLKAVLVEARDFASGTSSRSSKLIHGGLRYIKSLDFHVTRESCLERNLNLTLNSRMVKPIPFLIPVYKNNKPHKMAIKALLHTYDFLSGYNNAQNHRFLTKEETLHYGPGLSSEGLIGSYIYYDAMVNDARFTLETIKDGVRYGGIALNYSAVTGFVKTGGKIDGIIIEDTLSHTVHTVKGKVIINATGPATDIIRAYDDPDCTPIMILSRGTHLVFDCKDIPINITTTLFSPIDNRALFLIKHDNCFLFGTTDTWYTGDPGLTVPGEEDIEYLLESINRLFPSAHLGREQILSVYCGHRPLVAKKGKAAHPSDASREDYYEVSPSGLITVTGGKLTTARVMAQKTISLALKKLKKKTLPCVTGTQPVGDIPCVTQTRPVGDTKEEIKRMLSGWIIRYPRYEKFFITSYENFGIDAPELWDQVVLSRIQKRTCDPEEIKLRYMCKREMVCTLEDLLERRIGDIGLTNREKIEYVRAYGKIIEENLQITNEEFNEQLAQYRIHLKNDHTVQPGIHHLEIQKAV